MPILQDGELVLYGFVGDDFWGDGFTAAQVLAALAEHGRENDITVRLNSGGGIVDEGLAIYNALAAHRGEVRMEIDAIAASSASIIAMAGDRIVMKAGSVMMIHDPASITIGTIADHEKSIEMLTAYSGQMASIYAERSGNETDAVRADMEAEIWLTADQAVERGYADEAEKAKAKAVAAFDYRAYANAPDRLKTLARKRNWSFETEHKAAASASASTRQQKETTMSEKQKAEDNAADTEAAISEAAKKAVAADRERRKAVLALDETKGREALAEHLLGTEMDVDAIKATLAAAPKAAEEKRPAASYEEQRSLAAGLARPEASSQGRPKATINAGEIYAARRTH
ncbi:head maturation protease, ClpP-related [Afifella sp. IM 167]|uniref:head maturation protease, ClpP-related n=1 Tax=Afifella sp. IM 167 TaxID=2033586 RepID=UPI001CC9E4CC|nr:head maturation protease, ClpP-related [Afifella sp. IM 167]MBZ8133234.1 Clp protease [Afifella sp. IM 167]